MFSIIVSIYKVEKYLRQCIESILCQTCTDFELILVDDGSPDECPKICDEFERLDKRIRVIHKKNEGLISTRKTGIFEAKGEYVCFIDGDDFIQNDMLETFANALQKKHADIICSDYTYFYEENSQYRNRQRIPTGFYDKKMLKDFVYGQMLSVEPFFSFYVYPNLCTKCFRTEIMKKIYSKMNYNITHGEDAAATYPALLIADSIDVLDYSGYFYRQNPSSMTRSYNPRLYEQLRQLIIHLKTISSVYKWNAEKQIDQYSVHVLFLARDNELQYNRSDSYRTRKENLLKYVRDELFTDAIKNVKVMGLRNKVVCWCFKYKVILPLYIWCHKNEWKSGGKRQHGSNKE